MTQKKNCSLVFTVKQSRKSVVCVCFLSDETMVINVFCGVVSGVLSSSLANPTDVLKVSLDTDGCSSVPNKVESEVDHFLFESSEPPHEVFPWWYPD